MHDIMQTAQHPVCNYICLCVAIDLLLFNSHNLSFMFQEGSKQIKKKKKNHYERYDNAGSNIKIDKIDK